ncbi:mandelate racemase/muconate lactonizing enzyme family protein [Nitratireductor kimnyeongensis]|uniref:Mandelate racemase/muconate lactonizing enzyme family protein n=1 Tax=Nitratireductor kimnyeongensis TaxID=430679 RepID=A0ABW0TDI9_9HYPH|nr:mandelate racemase/muconate lactonizing enzyme family protein [Nitratireductor kimnyeongensis]QZZ36949.1 mandelate racemase/muconate lactonizing enzyme family protein [Nitratireductor kimnyeongensis]
MKITAANIYVVPTGFRRAVILELETDEGITGLGEAGIAYGLGTTAAAEMLAAMLERLVIGRDPSPVELIWNDIYDQGFWTKGGGAISIAGLSAIDHALWDIKGKTLGVPVYSLLGGPIETELDVYANGWWLGCDNGSEFAEAGLRTVDRGYRGLKLYPLGMADPVTVIRHPARRSLREGELALVIDRVEKLRAAVGDDIAIMLDFGGGLSSDQLLPLLRRLEPFGVCFVEEPVDPALPGALKRVGRQTSIPLAAGERVYTRYGFHSLLETGAVSIIQPDLCNTGGLMEGRKIAALAEIHNVRVAPHNYGSTLATAISAQLAACIPNFMVLECFPDYAREPDYRPILENPWEDNVRNGRMILDALPGLGAVLDKASVKNHLWKRVTLE